jgi:AcrR family transcriptional regulator
MDAEGAGDAAEAAGQRPGYRRSAGSRRGEARHRDLLDRVTEDLAVNGLVDFSLRRAARAAGTTHKVLLYYFDGVDDLLAQAVFRLRERRIQDALAAADRGQAPDQGPNQGPNQGGPRGTLASRISAVWPILVGEQAGLHRVLDQAIGLAMYDPPRYAALGRGASGQYLPSLLTLCPDGWSDQRKLEVSEMILAALRGFLVHASISSDGDTPGAGTEAGLRALLRALEREEAADG